MQSQHVGDDRSIGIASSDTQTYRFVRSFLSANSVLRVSIFDEITGDDEIYGGKEKGI